MIDCVLGLDPSETTEDQPLDRARILLADDHAEFLALTAALVGSEFEVLQTYGDGQTLVDDPAVADADLLVLDISMTGLGGIDAALQLRAAGNQAMAAWVRGRG